MKPITEEEAFRAVRAHCRAKDGAIEDYPWGHTAWKVRGRLFAIGGEGSARVTVKSTPDRQSALILHPHIEIASHVGRFGWVTITVADEDTLALCLQLIDDSFELVARPPRTSNKGSHRRGARSEAR